MNVNKVYYNVNDINIKINKIDIPKYLIKFDNIINVFSYDFYLIFLSMKGNVFFINKKDDIIMIYDDINNCLIDFKDNSCLLNKTKSNIIDVLVMNDWNRVYFIQKQLNVLNYNCINKNETLFDYFQYSK